MHLGMEDRATGRVSMLVLVPWFKAYRTRSRTYVHDYKNRRALFLRPAYRRQRLAAGVGEGLKIMTRRCTTRSTKGFEIEFRALLTDGAQEEVRFERVVAS